MRAIRLIAGACACLLPLAAAAQQDRVYTWTDANGVTHYSESPPASGAYQERTFSRSGASGPVERDPRQDPEAGTGDDPAASEDCRRARHNLEVLGGEANVVIDRGDGETGQPLDETERANQLELASAEVRIYCGDGAP